MSRSGLQTLDDLIGELSAVVKGSNALPVTPITPSSSSMGGMQQLSYIIQELDAVVGSKQQSSADPGKGKQTKAPKVHKVAPVPAPVSAAQPATELSVNALDLRVGVIRTVQRHETADKLYCEEIDCGEAEPRAIASGLVPYYSLEEMQGRRLIVVCNLVPRKLVGFKSHGMVLCASKSGPDGRVSDSLLKPLFT
jgi:aminoacyl tRNA synthase complex-interacting multifunctional protein 1